MKIKDSKKIWILICIFDFCILIFGFGEAFPQGSAKRDPFAPPLNLREKLKSSGKGAAESWPALELYGILTSEGGLPAKALINDRVLSIGESIGPVKVVEIGKKDVKVELDGEVRTLIIKNR